MKINSLEDLKKEKLRIKIELEAAESKLKDDLYWITEELRPLGKITKGAGAIFSSKNNSIVGDTIGAGLGLIVSKLFLRNSSWLTRILVPRILKNVSSNIISENKIDMMTILRSFVHMVKKDRYKGNGHYDRSTAQSHF